ncbi:MAG: metallophosphoesterase, partial [Isosphaeraceae bacterium]
MKLAWLTDIHLNFVTSEVIESLCRDVVATRAEAVLLGGDIAEAPDVTSHLETLAARIQRPIYFVLGNHDFYRGGIESVRESIQALVRRHRGLFWLPDRGVVPLTERTALVGHDGWADGRIGDYERSPLILNDYRLIKEFKDLEETPRRDKLEALGDEAADHLRAVLPLALERFQHVLVLTHVPPFREACAHPGRFSWDDWLPHFTCKAMGDALLEAADAFSERHVTVYCGHVHNDN